MVNMLLDAGGKSYCCSASNSSEHNSFCMLVCTNDISVAQTAIVIL